MKPIFFELAGCSDTGKCRRRRRHSNSITVLLVSDAADVAVRAGGIGDGRGGRIQPEHAECHAQRSHRSQGRAHAAHRQGTACRTAPVAPFCVQWLLTWWVADWRCGHNPIWMSSICPLNALLMSKLRKKHLPRIAHLPLFPMTCSLLVVWKEPRFYVSKLLRFY